MKIKKDGHNLFTSCPTIIYDTHILYLVILRQHYLLILRKVSSMHFSYTACNTTNVFWMCSTLDICGISVSSPCKKSLQGSCSIDLAICLLSSSFVIEYYGITLYTLLLDMRGLRRNANLTLNCCSLAPNILPQLVDLLNLANTNSQSTY